MATGAIKVVAIARTLGAEGEQIGGRVARRLGFRYFDEEIVTAAAKKVGVDPAVVADAEDRKTIIAQVLKDVGEAGAPGDATANDDPAELDFGALIREAIHETAERGDVVIVAHAASFALAGREDLLRVLVTAPVEHRVQRLATARGLDADQAAKNVENSDAARADYLKRFYGIDRELPSHYDLVVDTAVHGQDEASALIVSAAGG